MCLAGWILQEINGTLKEINGILKEINGILKEPLACCLPQWHWQTPELWMSLEEINGIHWGTNEMLKKNNGILNEINGIL